MSISNDECAAHRASLQRMTFWQFFWSIVFGINPCPVEPDMQMYFSWRITGIVIVLWLIELTAGGK